MAPATCSRKSTFQRIRNSKFIAKTDNDGYPTLISTVTVEERDKRNILLKIYRANDGAVLVDLRSWGVRTDGNLWPESSGIRVPWKSYTDLALAIYDKYVKDPTNIELKIKVTSCPWVARFHGDVITDPGHGPAQAHGNFRHVHIDTPTEPLWLSPKGLRFLMEFNDGFGRGIGRYVQ